MQQTLQRPSATALLRYFLYLGSLGFGGPVALVGYMQRDLVERRAWFTREEYLKSLALSQLAPGPLAAQLAICLGYVHSRVRGATLVALAFILPSFVMTVGIGWLYVQVRRADLDAGGLLRRGRHRDRDHRPRRVEARDADAGPGPRCNGRSSP